jgi:hypothetical protein
MCTAMASSTAEWGCTLVLGSAKCLHSVQLLLLLPPVCCCCCCPSAAHHDLIWSRNRCSFLISFLRSASNFSF